jgi:two-component system nitrate/nitrite response regulator NarL
MVRDALTDAIKRRPDFELLGSAGDGRAALEEIAKLTPDVALLDIHMPGLDGPNVLAAIVRDEIPTAVVFLTGTPESGDAYAQIAGGAAGYLDKSAPQGEVCDAVAAAARGEVTLGAIFEQDVLGEIRHHGESPRPELSAREREVLALVAEGLSAPAIGQRLIIEESTVKTHLRNIYEKLEVTERAAAVAEAMRRGLLE